MRLHQLGRHDRQLLRELRERTECLVDLTEAEQAATLEQIYDVRDSQLRYLMFGGCHGGQSAHRGVA